MASKKIDKGKHIFTSVAAGYMRFFISFFILWFLTPYIIKSVGIDDFGLWTLVFSVLGFYELLDLGFANGVIKYVAECDALEQYSRRNQLLSTILFVYCSLAAIGMVALGALAFVFNDLFAIPASQGGKALALLGVLSIRCLVLGLPASLFRGILYGDKKIPLINAISTVCSLLYGLTAFMAMAMGYGVISLAVLTTATFFLEAVGYVYFSYRTVPELRLSWSLVDLSKLRELASFCMMQFVANVSSMLILRTDPIIIKLFSSIFFVSIYAIPLRVVTYIYMFINQFTDVLSPFIARLHATDEHVEIRALFLQCTKYALALSTLFLVLGSVFADNLILLWLGAEFTLSIVPLIILLGAMWINSTHIVAAQVLAMSGHHRLLTVYFLITALLHIILSIILIYPLGINGVAIATLISALFGFFAYNKRVCDLFHSGYWEYFTAAILPIIIPGVALAAVEMALKVTFPPTNLLYLIMVSVPGTLLFALLFWAVSLNQEERTLFKNFFISMIYRRKLL